MGGTKGVLFLYGQSWLHPGAGASTEAIDLPVQREVHTKYPVIPASSVKGSLREVAEETVPQGVVDSIFGPGVGTDEHFAGALSVGDAKLLLFPVRSLTRLFFWVTSPIALERFRRDLRLVGLDPDWEVPSVDKEKALLPTECDTPSRLYLEELDFEPQGMPQVSAIAEYIADKLQAEVIGEVFQKKLTTDLAVVDDEQFSYFVRYATQVSARTQLTSNKTTDATVGPDGKSGEKGNLWYEETLPPETVFYVPLMADGAKGGEAKEDLNSGRAVMDKLSTEVLARPYIQLGGNETLGHGWCATFLVRGDE